MKKTIVSFILTLLFMGLIIGCRHISGMHFDDVEANLVSENEERIVIASADEEKIFVEESVSSQSEITGIEESKLPVFVKYEENGTAYIVSYLLEGTYTVPSRTGILQFSILLINGDAYFILYEDKEEKALSSIKSLNETYTIEIHAEDESYVYRIGVSKDGKSIYNTFKIKGLEYLFADYSQISLTIKNNNGVYELGEVNTSQIKDFFYDDNYYAQALALFQNKKYSEALEVLTFLGEDSGVYITSKIEELREQIKESAYQEAFNLYINGNPKGAITLLDLCDRTDKEVYRLLAECSKELGIHYLGETIQFGIKGTEWIVVDMEELENSRFKVLLISKDIVDARVYDDYGNGDWEKCSLRKYLNSKEFLDSFFTKEEQNQLLEIQMDGYCDLVTLLNKDEVTKYLILDEQRVASSEWWLRSISSYISYVYAGGRIRYSSWLDYVASYVNNASRNIDWLENKYGVRPVISIILN